MKKRTLFSGPGFRIEETGDIWSDHLPLNKDDIDLLVHEIVRLRLKYEPPLDDIVAFWRDGTWGRHYRLYESGKLEYLDEKEWGTKWIDATATVQYDHSSALRDRLIAISKGGVS